MKNFLFLVLALALGAMGITGCGGDEPPGTDGTEDTNPGPDTDSCQRKDASTGAEVGEPCWEIEDCKSGACEISRSIPDPGDGVCVEANPADVLTIQATVRDYETGEVLGNQLVDFGAALAFSVNPVGAAAVASGTSDANGIVDIKMDTKACTDDKLKLGIIGRVKKDGYFLSIGGLVAPEVNPKNGIYPSVLRNHDIMAVPASLLTQWSEFLADDPEVKNYLPLGTKGGCVVRVRKTSDGNGVAGTKLRSNTNPDGSTAILRYLNEAKDGFNTTGMGSDGMALVLKPGMGEQFDAIDGDGKIVSHKPGTMGSAPNGIFTNTLHICDTPICE
ncbi:MAG: hypothetical protein MUC50_15835 [Myxococcota bacterium]|nr:hypothetical protein [Myxococcota bacterium]